MIGNHVNPQGFPGFESLSLRQQNQRDSEPEAEVVRREPDAPFAPPFAPPLEEEELEAAIARLTRALTTADDEAIPALVEERRALREELGEMGEHGAGVVRLGDQRARRGRER